MILHAKAGRVRGICTCPMHVCLITQKARADWHHDNDDCSHALVYQSAWVPEIHRNIAKISNTSYSVDDERTVEWTLDSIIKSAFWAYLVIWSIQQYSKFNSAQQMKLQSLTSTLLKYDRKTNKEIFFGSTSDYQPFHVYFTANSGGEH